MNVRRHITLLAALVLVAAAFPAPASADNNCDAGEFCLWSDTNYSGSDFWDPSGSDPDYNFFGIENDDNSVKNRESYRVYVYPNNNYGGTYRYCMDQGETEDDIASDRDDDADSNLTSGNYTTCPAGSRHP